MSVLCEDMSDYLLLLVLQMTSHSQNAFHQLLSIYSLLFPDVLHSCQQCFSNNDFPAQ